MRSLKIVRGFSPTSNSFSLLALSFTWCAVVTWTDPVLAQTAKEKYWRRIKEADGRIDACRVIWKRNYVRKPYQRATTETHIARVMEEARQRGESEAGIRSAGKLMRETLQKEAVGSTQSAKLTFVRQGLTTRSDVIEGPPISPGIAPGTTAYFIDYYDGKNAVALEGVGKVLPKHGTLTRAKEEILNHSAAGFLPIFLTGAPITEIFSPSNSSLREGKNDTIVLEKSIPDKNVSYVLRLAISKQTWRPTVMEVVFPNDNNWIGERYTASSYQRYPNDIWFPTKIIGVFFIGKKGDSTASLDYQLVQAAFNNSAVLSDLKVPAGTLLTDRRFGGRGVTYKLTDKLPSDERVRKLLATQQADSKAELAREQRSTALPITLSLGALFTTLGIALWMRSRRPEST